MSGFMPTEQCRLANLARHELLSNKLWGGEIEFSWEPHGEGIRACITHQSRGHTFIVRSVLMPPMSVSEIWRACRIMIMSLTGSYATQAVHETRCDDDE